MTLFTYVSWRVHLDDVMFWRSVYLTACLYCFLCLNIRYGCNGRCLSMFTLLARKCYNVCNLIKYLISSMEISFTFVSTKLHKTKFQVLLCLTTISHMKLNHQNNHLLFQIFKRLCAYFKYHCEWKKQGLWCFSLTETSMYRCRQSKWY